MRFRLSRMAIITFPLLSSLLFAGASRAIAANKAVIIGPAYPGPPAFDDTIAQTRANQI